MKHPPASPADFVIAQAPGPLKTRPDETSLDAISQLIVKLAARDPIRTVRPASRVARALAALFGIGRANGLANQRLECLRQFCVLLRKGDRTADDRLTELVDIHGYTPGEIAQVIRLVTTGRA